MGRLCGNPSCPTSKSCRHWQQRLKRVTKLDEDPYDQPVNLADVIDAAKEEAPAADADWS